MKYMLLIYADPDRQLDPASPEWQKLNAEWMQITEEMADVSDGGAALHPVQTATTVRADRPGGEPVLTDGPYAETKEFLAGYYVLDVPDLDTAVGWASRLPLHPDGSVEVRPVVDYTAQ